MNRQELEQALQNENMRKFLTFLSMSEGTAPFKDPYLAKGGTRGALLSTGYKNHPAMLGKEGHWYFKDNDGKKLLSTANGRYAIKKSTWEMANKALGGNLTFNPQDQDLAAAYLIANRGALKDVLDGNINQAIQKVGKEWASLPTAPDSYNQHRNQWDRIHGMLASSGFDPKALGLTNEVKPHTVKQYAIPEQGAVTSKAVNGIIPPAVQREKDPIQALAGDMDTGSVPQQYANLGRRSPIDVMATTYRPIVNNAWRQKSAIEALSGF